MARRAVYELDLTNEGQAPASNVTVVITASELRLDSAPTPVGDFVWRDVLDLGEIAPGERQTVAFSGTVAFNVDNTDESAALSAWMRTSRMIARPMWGADLRALRRPQHRLSPAQLCGNLPAAHADRPGRQSSPGRGA